MSRGAVPATATAAGSRAAGHAKALLALRAGLVLLAVIETLVGTVALLLPRTFYGRVPGVDLLGPYNEHLMTDVGELNLALALGLVIAAVTLQRLLVRTVLAGYLLYAVPHLLFHVTHLAGFGTLTAAIQNTGLVITAVLPAGLLILTRPAFGPRPGGQTPGSGAMD